MNWVLVGIGDVAVRRVLPVLKAEPRSTLYGVVTRNPARSGVHAPRTWAHLAEALKDPGVDAVYIATPVYLHHPQTIAALRAGKHVLCEKPAALTYIEAQDMVQTARACDRLLGIAYFRRLYPKLIRARQLLEQRAIGKPVMAFAACSEWFSDEDGQRNWLLDPARAGAGPLYDIGSHRIDAMNFLFGAPRRASSQLSNVLHQTKVEDSATVLIEYDNGVHAIVDARWNTRADGDEFFIVGTEGKMDLSPLSGPRLSHPGGDEMLPCAINRHEPCIRNFVAAVLDGVPCACTGEACLPAMRVLDESLKKGRD